MLLFCSNILAGFHSTQRNSCKWWSRKYQATARVFTGLIASQTTGNCGYAYAEKIKNCAWQKVSRGDNGFWEQGGVKNKFCSRGEVISSFEEFFLPSSNVSEENVEESEVKTGAAVFDENSHSIIIPNISGKIKLQKNNGYYSDLRFSIWRPNDDSVNLIEDETVDDSEILHKIAIKLTDKGLIFNGDLVDEDFKSKFKVVDDGKEIYVEFTEVSLKIAIDPNISLNDLAVQIEGDGAPDTESNVAKMIQNTDLSTTNDYKFSVYPNPAANFVNVEFLNSVSNATTNIRLYNLLGEEIQNIYNGNINKGKLKSLKIDISSLPIGTYLLLIDSGGKKLTKKIIKN